ncbi:FHA domain-containing protein FHA2-like isoform X2 [Panicum virgatum]|uniref:FHA domain-containing protein n=2 Tax=Panicum virgatum TaxID=38727 RepID=A0A8T0VMV2_PANVG|nr:FHA domain-containing protein FHA2-like isoform X2 [Panicum virgatum]KAG2636025.1 hypothetical protein PVAP13_2NG417800 [Panicum virgatum]
MEAPNSSVVSVDRGHILPGFAKPGFAKLQGKDFEYVIQKYSIILGRSTKTCKVDLDLSELGGGRGPRVSRHHARIFYDFDRHHFALEVLGKNGCSIGNFTYLPGSDPIKLESQYLIEIAGKKFYFLLAIRSVAATLAAWGAHASSVPQSSSLMLPDGPGHSYADGYDPSNGENGVRQSRRFSGELDISNSDGIAADPAGTDGESENDTEDQQLLDEEKDIVSSLVLLIPDICSPGEWVPMEKLHSELLERFGYNWPSARVRRYLQQQDASVSSTETEGRPWCNLLPLLRKYPDDFVLSSVTRGEVTTEYVGLVSLVSLGNGP